MAAPNDHELELITQFRKRLRDLDLGERNRDMFLIRFLRARDFNLNQAEDMLRKHVTWLRVNQIDSLLNWEAPKFLTEEFPYDLTGYDREGCPIFVVPVGIWDVRQVCEMGQRPAYVRYVDQIFIKILHDMKLSSSHRPVEVTQFVAIFVVDCLQYYRQMSCYQAVDSVLETVKRFEANHPETLKAAFIVDAPRLFSIIFSAIRPLLNGKTLGKVLISSNEAEWKSAILKHADLSSLPLRLGGTGTSTISLLNARRGEYSHKTDKSKAAWDCDYIKVIVEAGKKLSLHFDVDVSNTCLSWDFKTDKHDISFSLEFEDKILCPPERVNAHLEAQSGAHLCESPGKFTLVFDNTYSRYRSKALKYKVDMTFPIVSSAQELIPAMSCGLESPALQQG